MAHNKEVEGERNTPQEMQEQIQQMQAALTQKDSALAAVKKSNEVLHYECLRLQQELIAAVDKETELYAVQHMLEERLQTAQANHEMRCADYKRRCEEYQSSCEKYESVRLQLTAQAELLTQQNIDRQQKLDSVLSYAAGYYPLNWATGLIPFWRSYYGHHYDEIPKLVERLKKELDQESCETIDVLCERNFELLPPACYAQKFLYLYDGLYTDREKKGLAAPCDKEAFRTRFVIPPERYLETTVVEFHNGLTCLPPPVLQQITGRSILDGGAFWGDSALAFLEYKPSKIYCFEPSEANFELLQQTIRENHLEDRVVPNQVGLSNDCASGELVSYGMDSSRSFCDYNVLATPEQVREVESVQLTTIDRYVAEHTLDVGLLKLDIEGMEYQAICGALETIRKCRPILLISVYHMPKDFFEIKPMLEALGLGYRFMVRKTTYRDLIAEVMLIGYIENNQGELRI